MLVGDKNRVGLSEFLGCDARGEQAAGVVAEERVDHQSSGAGREFEPRLPEPASGHLGGRGTHRARIQTRIVEGPRRDHSL